MSPLVYIVRHGQTQWNVDYRLQGQADIPITEEGRRQASANGRHLAELISDPTAFDFVASPLIRTRTTMELIRAAMGLDPKAYRTDARLMEMNFGDWQGYTFAELEARNPGCTRGREEDKWNFVPPGKGAEGYELLCERVRPFFAEIAKPTVCVTHGGVIRSLFHIFGGLDGIAAANVETPQDRVLKLQDGQLAWL
jgi:probable phosphoglycerate mutase